MRFESILKEIVEERNRAEEKHGPQNLPLGTSLRNKWRADYSRDLCDSARKRNRLTWHHVLNEEIAEAMAETDHQKCRAELLQAGAIICKIIEAIDNGEIINE